MAELNFGLLTPPGSQSIGNAFVSGMDQAAAARAQENQNALSQYTLSKARREDEVNNRLLNDLRAAKTPQEQRQAYINAGRAKDAAEMESASLKNQEIQGKINLQPGAMAKTLAETTKLQDENRFRVIGEIASFPDAVSANQAIDSREASKAISSEDAQRMRKDLTDENFTNWKRNTLMKILSPAEQLRQNAVTHTDTNRGGFVGRQYFDAQGKAVGPEERLDLTVSPNTTATIEATRKNHLETLAAETATGKFTPDTIDFLAQTYVQTGTLPALGMGKPAAELRQKVLERAAILARTPAADAAGAPISAADAAKTVGQNKQEFAGGTSGQRTLGTTLANVTSAATEANNMMPLVSKYAALVDPTDFPLVNPAGNYVARKGGGTAIVGLAGSLNALINAYARAINPKGVATVSDKNHARDIINEAMSKGQIDTALSVMSAEMESAMSAPRQVQEKMRSGNKPPVAGKPSLDDIFREKKP